MTLPHWVLPASEAFIRQTSVNRLHMERPAVSYLPPLGAKGQLEGPGPAMSPECAQTTDGFLLPSQVMMKRKVKRLNPQRKG